VYVYRRDGAAWQEEALLFAPDGATGDLFGSSIAFLDPDRIAIGAVGHDADGTGAGATYLFQRQEVWAPLVEPAR
jgi:hypothetical protein